MGDSRQSVARAVEAGRLDIRVPAERRGVLREASARQMINPDSALLRNTEEIAEAEILLKLCKLREQWGPDVAEAAIEGGLRAVTIYLGGGEAAYNVLSRAADAAIEPALKTNTSS